ncbi:MULTISPECIES: hypothetical protein [unclassified Adlercreutzia]|uniref:hypothetical protein n=1 Tax=unclassified Adlercreutzia TaxID=2636013 RepID=UPI0013ED13FC|nr:MULTISPECIES: hypothetical protein [unclassified Adlercreutzia]
MIEITRDNFESIELRGRRYQYRGLTFSLESELDTWSCDVWLDLPKELRDQLHDKGVPYKWQFNAGSLPDPNYRLAVEELMDYVDGIFEHIETSSNSADD